MKAVKASRILVIGDDEKYALGVELVLMMYGFSVASMSGHKAMETLRQVAAGSQSYDLILMDVQAPYNICRQVIHLVNAAEITTPMLVTLERDEDNIRKAIQKMNLHSNIEFVNKPFEPHDLAGTIAMIIDLPTIGGMGNGMTAKCA